MGYKIVTIQSLKKNEQFMFNDRQYKVKKAFKLWKKNDDPFLLTYCGEIFYHNGLEVALLP